MFFSRRICLISLCILLVSLSSLILPVAADLPPRPTPIPTVEKTSVSPQGGFITLTAVSNEPTTSLWTKTQWQDSQEVWHEVDGWQGSFDQDSNIIWWVAPEDLSKGPFRWVVYDAEDSTMIMATSDTFFLPAEPQQTTPVTVTLTIP